MIFRKSPDYPAISYGVDVREYMRLGCEFERGDARRVVSQSDLKRFESHAHEETRTVHEYERGGAKRVICRSDLKRIAINPRKWKLGWPNERTESTDWGNLIDCLLTTPDRFDSVYVTCPLTYPAKGKKKDDPPIDKTWNRNASYCEEWEAKQKAEGKIPIKLDELSEARRAVLRLQEETEISKLLATCDKQVQVVVEYHDAETGVVVPIKCLLDLVPHSKSEYAQVLADLKTGSDISPRKWARTIVDFGYDAQAAMYLDAWNAATGENRTTFQHIAQESKSPFEPALWTLSEEFVMLGRSKYLEALRLYCRCIRDNKWSGYESDSLIPGMIEPTPWMTRDGTMEGVGDGN